MASRKTRSFRRILLGENQKSRREAMRRSIDDMSGKALGALPNQEPSRHNEAHCGSLGKSVMPSNKKDPVLIAVANQKGGVGKTTIAVQLAYDMTWRLQKRVLFVDMDAQGNGSTVLRAGEPIHEDTTLAYELFEVDAERDEPLVVHPQQTPEGIDLIPTIANNKLTYSLEALDDSYLKLPEHHIAKILDQYDVVIFDCPPALGTKLNASLAAATHVLCPIRLCGFALEGLSGLLETIMDIQSSVNTKLQILGALVNAFDRSNNHKRELVALKQELPNMVLTSILHNRAPFDSANMMSCPVSDVMNGQKAAQELESCFNEIYRKLGFSIPTAATQQKRREARIARRLADIEAAQKSEASAASDAEGEDAE